MSEPVRITRELNVCTGCGGRFLRRAVFPMTTCWACPLCGCQETRHECDVVIDGGAGLAVLP